MRWTRATAMVAAALAWLPATQAAAFSERGSTQVRQGMTEAQVVGLVGQPNARIRSNGRITMLWVHERRSGLYGRKRTITLALQFGRDGRLVRPVPI
jgi:hypothetical protein